MDKEWVSLPCIVNRDKTLDVNIRKSDVSFIRIWRDAENNIDPKSSAMYFRITRKPMQVPMSIEDVALAFPELSTYYMANGERVLINQDNIRMYREFIDDKSKSQKYIIYMPSTNFSDEVFFIVKDNPESMIQ
jgi:hypothetical protein